MIEKIRKIFEAFRHLMFALRIYPLREGTTAWAAGSTIVIFAVSAIIPFVFPIVRHSHYMIFTNFIIALILTYTTLYGEAGNLEKYKKFSEGLRERKIQKIYDFSPKWLINALQLIVILMMMSIFYSQKYHSDFFIRTTIAATTFVLFTARDGIVFHIIKLGNKHSRPGRLISIYFFCVYIFLPAISFWGVHALFGAGSNENYADPEFSLYISTLSLFGQSNDPLTISKNIFGFFYPNIKNTFVFGLLPPLLEVMLALYILKNHLLNLNNQAIANGQE